MWEVFIWVPTKGWKLVFRGKNETKAREAFVDFQPLEVKLCREGYSIDFGGIYCKPQYDMEDRIKEILRNN